MGGAGTTIADIATGGFYSGGKNLAKGKVGSAFWDVMMPAATVSGDIGGQDVRKKAQIASALAAAAAVAGPAVMGSFGAGGASGAGTAAGSSLPTVGSTTVPAASGGSLTVPGSTFVPATFGSTGGGAGGASGVGNAAGGAAGMSGTNMLQNAFLATSVGGMLRNAINPPPLYPPSGIPNVPTGGGGGFTPVANNASQQWAQLMAQRRAQQTGKFTV